MPADCIYILANASMPGLFKVGVTTKERLTARARELYSTGVPTPFAHVWDKETLFAERIEQLIKNSAVAQRHTLRREFYCADVPTLIRLIEEFDTGIRSAQTGTDPEVARERQTVEAPPDHPEGPCRFLSFDPGCEVIEGPDGSPIVRTHWMRNPVADLHALSPLPYPVHWIIVDTFGAGAHHIDVDLRNPEQRREHGPWIAGSILGYCLDISSDELPAALVEEHCVMGFAWVGRFFEKAFEQLAERGFQLGESADFWVAAWAWARRVLGSDQEIGIPSSFPREWLQVQARPVPEGPTFPLTLFSGPLVES